jgi:hypothetical protein
MRHPLLDVLERAAAGQHPPVDGGVTLLPPVAGGHRAVVALTGHAFLCTDQAPEEFADLDLDGFGAALSPRALLRLADGGEVGVNDIILAATGLADGGPEVGGVDLRPTRAWDDHPRVAHARRLRTDVRVHGDQRGFVVIACGLAGRQELSIEIAAPGVEPGLGRRFVTWARTMVDPGSWLFAAVSPGNARSLRAFLAAGFEPIGSEVIIDGPGGDRR